MGALGVSLVGADVLDLFAGSGALGLEALSRGSQSATFVERGRRPLEALRANVAALEAEDRVRIVAGDALQFLRTRSADAPAFDIALADPPYDQGFASRLLAFFQERPFARELWVEHRSKEELPALPGLRQRRYGDTTLTILEHRP